MSKSTSKYKIRQKFIILNFISVFLLVLILGAFSFYYSSGVLKHESEDKLKNLASEFTTRFNAQFQGKAAVITSLESIVQATFDADQMYSNDNYINEYKQFLTPIIYELALEFDDIYIFFNPDLVNESHDIWFIDVDLDGDLDRIAENPLSYYDNDYDNKAWFYKPILEKKAVWSKPYLSTMGLPFTFVSYTKPIYVSDQLIAVIGTDFIFDEMQEEIKSFKVFENGYGTLLDNEGNFLIHPDFPAGINLSEIDDKIYEDLFTNANDLNNNIVEYTWIDGSDKILAFNKLINNWNIVVTASKSDIYSNLNKFLIQLSLIIIFYVIISTLIFTYFGIKLISPIEHISLKIKSIGNGAYDDTLPDEYLHKTDEIGILSRSISTMQQNLKYSFEKINEQNRELDNTVNERTSELTAINQELQATLEHLESTQSKLIEYKKLKGLGLMLGGISHKLGGPVGNSLTGISTIHLKIGDLNSKIKTNSLSKSYLINALNSMSDLADLGTENLLTANYLLRSLKQINTNYKDDSAVKFDLIKTLETGLFYLHDILEKNNITYKFENKEPINLTFYPRYFSDLVINLVNFSIYYTLKQDSSGTLNFNVYQHNSLITILYSDSGPRIEPTIQDQLFNPFTLSRFSQNSTGMELFTVYHLVNDIFKGFILYEPEYDHFKITFDLDNLQS